MRKRHEPRQQRLAVGIGARDLAILAINSDAFLAGADQREGAIRSARQEDGIIDGNDRARRFDLGRRRA